MANFVLAAKGTCGISDCIHGKLVFSCNPNAVSQERLLEFPYVFAWGKILGMPTGRKGERCRVLVRGGKNSALIEFLSDGHKMVTSRNAIRKAVSSRSTTTARLC